MAEIVVVINGIESQVKKLAIRNIITRAPDTATFILEDPVNIPATGLPVIMYRDTPSNVIFGGIITGLTQKKLAPSQDASLRSYSYNIKCMDYQRLLDRYLVNNTYSSSNCSTIISDIIANYTDTGIGFTMNNVSRGPNITKVTFSYKRVSEAITELADLVGYDWYVDSDKDIHFFRRKTISSPYNIDDDALSYVDGKLVKDFRLTPDYSQVRNRIYVRGGYELSDVFTESFEADGTERVFSLSWKPHNISVFTVNGVGKTYAVDFINPDDGTFEYLWNYQEKYIRAAGFQPEPTPAAGHIISITYQYEIPILVRVDNPASQTALAQLEGGDGIYESVIKDRTISSKNEAQDRGEAELESFSNPLITGNFTTYDDGFQAGQAVVINLHGYAAYNDTYVIQQVWLSIPAPGLIKYEVSFATTLYELKDLILKLLRGNKRIVLRDDETIDVLKLVNERVVISEEIIADLDSGSTLWDLVTWDSFTWT